jgi:SH2 domain
MNLEELISELKKIRSHEVNQLLDIISSVVKRQSLRTTECELEEDALHFWTLKEYDYKVKVDHFLYSLMTYVGKTSNDRDRGYLRRVLCLVGDESISKDEFALFCNLFGSQDLKLTVKNAVEFSQKDYFEFGYTRQKAQEYLETKPQTTYLVRWSSERLGVLVVSYVNENNMVEHNEIVGLPENDFKDSIALKKTGKKTKPNSIYDNPTHICIEQAKMKIKN